MKEVMKGGGRRMEFGILMVVEGVAGLLVTVFFSPGQYQAVCNGSPSKHPSISLHVSSRQPDEQGPVTASRFVASRWHHPYSAQLSSVPVELVSVFCQLVSRKEGA